MRARAARARNERCAPVPGAVCHCEQVHTAGREGNASENSNQPVSVKAKYTVKLNGACAGESTQRNVRMGTTHSAWGLPDLGWREFREAVGPFAGVSEECSRVWIGSGSEQQWPFPPQVATN